MHNQSARNKQKVFVYDSKMLQLNTNISPHNSDSWDWKQPNSKFYKSVKSQSCISFTYQECFGQIVIVVVNSKAVNNRHTWV